MTVERHGAWLEAEIRRVDALIDFGLAPGESGAVGALEHAIERARQMQAPVFERRCLLSLRDEIGAPSNVIDVEKMLRATVEFENLAGLVDDVMGNVMMVGNFPKVAERLAR